MKISHGTRIGSLYEANGYGYATKNMLDSLTRLGYSWANNDPTADVEIWFDQPHRWNFSKGPYRIGYHPWESTALKPGWAKIMNECDEIWTPSPLVAQWYHEYAGITRPVYVYEHGVDPIWSPVERTFNDKMKFLHCGSEALRKGSDMAMQSLRQALPTNNDISITMKVISDGWAVKKFGRINVVNESLSLLELIKMFQEHHVYIYPSWGEGFGLTPLQAMATGMPTITLPAWAPYKDFIDPNLAIDSELVDSPWRIHPGKMLKPNYDSLVEAVRYVYENYDTAATRALDQVPAILERYDWDNLTKSAFEKLRLRLENS